VEVRETLGVEVSLGEVDSTGEEYNAEDEKENEKTELAKTGADRQSEDL